MEHQNIFETSSSEELLIKNFTDRYLNKNKFSTSDASSDNDGSSQEPKHLKKLNSSRQYARGQTGETAAAATVMIPGNARLPALLDAKTVAADMVKVRYNANTMAKILTTKKKIAEEKADIKAKEAAEKAAKAAALKAPKVTPAKYRVRAPANAKPVELDWTTVRHNAVTLAKLASTNKAIAQDRAQALPLKARKVPKAPAPVIRYNAKTTAQMAAMAAKKMAETSSVESSVRDKPSTIVRSAVVLKRVAAEPLKEIPRGVGAKFTSVRPPAAERRSDSPQDEVWSAEKLGIAIPPPEDKKISSREHDMAKIQKLVASSLSSNGRYSTTSKKSKIAVALAGRS